MLANLISGRQFSNVIRPFNYMGLKPIFFCYPADSLVASLYLNKMADVYCVMLAIQRQV